MLKKKVFLLTMLLCLIGFATACEESVFGGKKNSRPDLPIQDNCLEETSWKLIGFFDIEKNELRYPENKDAYKIYFSDDTTLPFHNELGTVKVFNGRLVYGGFSGIYTGDCENSTITIKEHFVYTQDWQYERDCGVYERAFKMNIGQYKISDSELKLFYSVYDCIHCSGAFIIYDDVPICSYCNNNNPIRPFYLLFRRIA